MANKVLILGANSAIAREVARRYAERGDNLYLVGRDPDKLAATQQDLTARSKVKIFTEAVDLCDMTQHARLIKDVSTKLGGLGSVLIAHGELGNQKVMELDYAATLANFTSNFLSQVSLLTQLALVFEKQKHGTIAVITSVAGDRGRQSNYVYGTGKGALSIFLSGLRGRLYRANVAVVDLRLGYVDTPMTLAFPKSPLWASPAKVAQMIERAMDQRRNIVYAPWFWRWIMFIIKIIPESYFQRLRI